MNRGSRRKRATEERDRDKNLLKCVCLGPTGWRGLTEEKVYAARVYRAVGRMPVEGSNSSRVGKFRVGRWKSSREGQRLQSSSGRGEGDADSGLGCFGFAWGGWGVLLRGAWDRVCRPERGSV